MDPRRLNLKLHATDFMPESRTPTLRVHVRLINIQETLFRSIEGAYRMQDLHQLLPTAAFHIDMPYFDRLTPISAYQYILCTLSRHRLDHAVCDYLAAEILSMASTIFSTPGSGRLGVFITAEAMIISTRVIDEFDDILAGISDLVTSESCGYNDCGASPSFLCRLRRERRLDGEAAADRELGDCAVCLNKLSGATELIDLPCRHVFHEACIFRWLENKNSCPMCRQVPDTELLPGSLLGSA